MAVDLVSGFFFLSFISVLQRYPSLSGLPVSDREVYCLLFQFLFISLGAVEIFIFIDFQWQWALVLFSSFFFGSLSSLNSLDI